jgi:hypothetical protein
MFLIAKEKSMRISYLFIALSMLMVFGIAYAVTADEGDEPVSNDDEAGDDAALDDDADQGAEGDGTDDLGDAANDDDTSGDKLKRTHDNHTDLGGCGY